MISLSANNSFRRFFNAQLKNKIAFNNMKKILKIIGVLITVAIVAIGIYYIANNEALPNGVQGKEAEELAEKNDVSHQ